MPRLKVISEATIQIVVTAELAVETRGPGFTDITREVAKFVEGRLEDKEYERRLIVCDPDGKNAKTLATWKVKGLQTTDRESIDWR